MLSSDSGDEIFLRPLNYIFHCMINPIGHFHFKTTNPWLVRGLSMFDYRINADFVLMTMTMTQVTIRFVMVIEFPSACFSFLPVICL